MDFLNLSSEDVDNLEEDVAQEWILRLKELRKKSLDVLKAKLKSRVI